MKRIAIGCLLLLARFAADAGAATNPPSAALRLDDKALMEMTAGLKQYERPPKLAGKLTSVGSGIATLLINHWASEFSTFHPEAGLDIQGGGSVEGFARLLAGQTDLVPITRPLPPDDIARFKAKFGYEPAQIVVAQDAVGVYVNKDNPVAGLTLTQLESIFSSEPRGGGALPEFWNDVGVAGPLAKERIHRVSLSRVHGTYVFLQEEVLHGRNYRLDVRFEAVPSSLVQAAGADAAAIGCASIVFSTERTRFVPLQAGDGSWLLPSYENIVSGRYPLVHPMRIVFNCKPDGSMNPVARQFLRFAVSRRGQRVIAVAHSYPLTLEQQQQALRVIGEAPPLQAGPQRRTP